MAEAPGEYSGTFAILSIETFKQTSIAEHKPQLQVIEGFLDGGKCSLI